MVKEMHHDARWTAIGRSSATRQACGPSITLYSGLLSLVDRVPAS